jgi:hypothetical protein
MPNAEEIITVATINSATVAGILLLTTIALSFAVVYLYKRLEKLNTAFINEVKAFNAELIKSNNSYNEFVKNMLEINHRG